MGDYWGLAYFADLIVDPRQAAYDLIALSPTLRSACGEAGFDFHPGFPGFPDIEAIYFQDEAQLKPVRSG